MKKKYVEPVIIVEDFTLSDAIAAKNCKYTPYSNILVQQMSKFRPACADGNNDADTREFMEFSYLYSAEYDIDGDKNYYEESEKCFTTDFAQHSPGNCHMDPFVEEIAFGKDVAGNPCIQYGDPSSGDTSLLQNS